MMLICDICTNAYALYAQHEEACQAFSYKVEGHENAIYKAQVCYQCARRIDNVTRKVFLQPIPEE